MNQDHEWTTNLELVANLLDILGGRATDDSDRIAILWLFHYAGQFELANEAALKLSSGQMSSDLTHEAARVVVADAELQERLPALFRSSMGAVRAAAATALTHAGYEDEPWFCEVVAAVGAVARNAGLPPWVRGEAIEALGFAAERPQNREILLELLQPEYWFFGAAGQHFRVHSLAKVIDGLRSLESARVRQALEALQQKTSGLRSGEREYVEWVLRNALGDHEEIFYGPVEPD